jgi:hypothetical protein
MSSVIARAFFGDRATTKAGRLRPHAARTVLWMAALGVVGVPLVSPGSPLSLVDVAMAQPAAQLVISGDITNLTPGVAGDLTLTLRNDSSAPVDVASLTTQVTGSAGGCNAADLSVGRWHGQVAVAPQSAVEVTVPVMLRSGAAACAGSAWGLAYTSA